jgi:hypothetical protein
MKRRTFLSTLTAALAAPALPLPAAAPATHITQHFAKAKLLARCHDRASPEMFARLMQLDSQTAQGVFDLLKDRSVISKGLDGIMRAMNPLNTHCVPNEAIRARGFAQMSSDMGTRLKEMAKKRLNDVTEQPEPVDRSTETEAISDSETMLSFPDGPQNNV